MQYVLHLFLGEYMTNEEIKNASKILLFLLAAILASSIFTAWNGLITEQRMNRSVEELMWFQKYRDTAPHLQVFTRDVRNKTVYAVVENKTLWLEGKVSILFESSDPWEATQWALDHTCIVYLEEGVDLTFKKPLRGGINKWLVVKDATIRFSVEPQERFSSFIAMAVATTVGAIIYVINRYFIIKVEVKRRTNNQ